MDDLVQFLRYRLDEDETAARQNWNRDGVTSERFHGTPYDPARVLREVGAKRKIVERCVSVQGGLRDDFTADWLADDVLALLASSYADHPDYREEWRP